jgi:hypothetical protein
LRREEISQRKYDQLIGLEQLQRRDVDLYRDVQAQEKADKASAASAKKAQGKGAAKVQVLSHARLAPSVTPVRVCLRRTSHTAAVRVCLQLNHG